MFQIHDITRDEVMLRGGLRKKGYDWWWHSFTGKSEETGKERSFFIEYFLCNPALSGEHPVLGQKKENRKMKRRPSYLMVKAGSWGEGKSQLHRFFAWKDIVLRENAPFCVTADDCLASEKRIRGSVSVSVEQKLFHPDMMSDAGEMSWDLAVDKKTAFNVGYGASAPLRRIEAFEMYWHAEGMKTLYDGTVIYNGERYRVRPEDCYGYADKNWGRDFTSPWVWLSSNRMMSLKTGKILENSVFDIGGGCPKIYFVPLNSRLLGAFYYEGKEYEYNFSKPWTMSRSVFHFKETDTHVSWYVIMENRTSVMETKITCKKSDMLLLNYESPDGEKRHNRLFNGGNGYGRIRLYEKDGGYLVLVDEIAVSHVGCEFGTY